jgi:hypothetical protein
MWLNQDSLARSLIYATSTPEVPSTYIHPCPSPEPPKNILLLIRERIAKNISVFPCEINAQVILLLPLAILSQEMSALKRKKRKKKKINEEIKRGKCPEPRKKEKVRREVKMDKCPTVELGVQDTHLREEKEEHLILFTKFQKARKVCIPSKEQK